MPDARRKKRRCRLWQHISMFQATLYARCNVTQREGVSRLLRELSGRLRWSPQDDTVLDVGCGPGDVTTKFLLPWLPSSVRALVGHDVSEEMVKHASTAHAALAPRVRFLCTDIAARDLPATPLGECAKQLGNFSKIFTFYALNFVSDQRTALRNIHSLLRPGGEALLLVVANAAVNDAYIAIRNNPNWAKYMQDAYSYISPYSYHFHSTDLVKDFSTALQDAGLHVQACRLEEVRYSYPTIQDYTDCVTSLNPFLKRIPETLRSQYIEDLMRENQREKAKYLSENITHKVDQSDPRLCYSYLIAHAEKMKEN